MQVSLGVSFHNEESFVEAVGSLRFAADNSSSITRTGRIDQDGSLYVQHDDPNVVPDSVKERRDDEIGVVDR